MSLPEGTHISHVQLRVKDLVSELSFYRGLLGFHEANHFDSTLALSSSVPTDHGARAGQLSVQLLLTESINAVARPPRTTGLFHVAILYPNRVELAKTLLRLIRNGYPIQGAADHLVSEAIYLADPEGNGVELYCDRPKESWRWSNGEIAMATEPLHVEALLKEADGKEWTEIHPQTDIGHIHLNVGSLARVEEFYSKQLGFDVTARSYSGALFLSAGGYHHHIGVNVWAGRNAQHPPENSLGLISFGIAVPNAAQETLTDPDGIEVEIIPTNAKE